MSLSIFPHWKGTWQHTSLMWPPSYESTQHSVINHQEVIKCHKVKYLDNFDDNCPSNMVSHTKAQIVVDCYCYKCKWWTMEIQPDLVLPGRKRLVLWFFSCYKHKTNILKFQLLGSPKKWPHSIIHHLKAYTVVTQMILLQCVAWTGLQQKCSPLYLLNPTLVLTGVTMSLGFWFWLLQIEFWFGFLCIFLFWIWF